MAQPERFFDSRNMNRSLVLAVLLLTSAVALAQNPGGSHGGGLPAPGSSGLCLISTGAATYSWGSCSGSSSAAFSALTPGTNSTLGSYIASGNSWDYTATTFFGLRVGAGLVTTKNGDIGLDSTLSIWHLWAGADATIPAATSTTTNTAFALYSTGVAGKYAPRATVAGDLPATIVNAVTNDTNVTGTISGQTLTLGWTGSLATARGGTGTASALTGLVRGGSPFTAAELSGDCTTSGSNAVTCTKTSGTAFSALATTVPATGVAAFLATPSSLNLRAAVTDETGTGALYFAGGNAGTPSAINLSNATALSLALATINASGTPSSATFLRGDGTWSPASGGSGCTPPGTADAVLYDSGAGGCLGVTPPTVNGTYVLGYQVVAGVAVAPTATLIGFKGRAVTGTTATDTVLFSDAGFPVNYQGSVAVAVTLPTGTTLGNAAFGTILVNNTSGSSTAVTVTPTTWTVNGASSLVIAQGQSCKIYVDASGTNWDADCHDLPFVAGTNITITRGQFGPTLSASGGAAGVPSPGANGIVVCTGTACSTSTTRSLAVNAPLSVSNADGTAGNPTLGITANGIGATQLAAQYSKGSCTEVWGGTGTSNALSSGDDAISNNTCYNDSGVTRTITAVKCRSDVASNTTTVNPTFGSAGTGTTVLTGALTCGSSLSYSSSGVVANASWSTGTGIDPVQGGTLTGTSIAVIVEYTY
jgi:hypothetical protein